MTYEEACRLLGYEEPPDLSEFTRKVIVETALEQSEGGTKPIDESMANLCRAQIEEFG
ncbi:MAG: hypothetical protein JW990_10990 [Thermoleophilia bacterium]|nr:hypothetical protein [Thermoleophilia bacterium]